MHCPREEDCRGKCLQTREGNGARVYKFCTDVVSTNLFPQILYTYLARQYDAPGKTLTTDVSNTAFAALAKLVKKAPQAFTSFQFDGEEDFEQRGSGGMYTALWEGVTVVNSILPNNFEFGDQR